MSKLKPSETELSNRVIRCNIERYQGLKGLTLEDIALAARVNRASIYRRMNDPGLFRLDELRRVAQRLHVPLIDLLEIPIPPSEARQKQSRP